MTAYVRHSIYMYIIHMLDLNMWQAHETADPVEKELF